LSHSFIQKAYLEEQHLLLCNVNLEDNPKIICKIIKIYKNLYVSREETADATATKSKYITTMMHVFDLTCQASVSLRIHMYREKNVWSSSVLVVVVGTAAAGNLSEQQSSFDTLSQQMRSSKARST
jgi:hypothetical protein